MTVLSLGFMDGASFGDQSVGFSMFVNDLRTVALLHSPVINTSLCIIAEVLQYRVLRLTQVISCGNKLFILFQFATRIKKRPFFPSFSS